MSPGHSLPRGTVTFLFTDVEGSTRLLGELGAEGYADALAEHRRVLRDAFTAHGGVEVDTQGDAFFVAFPTAPGALAAATQILEGLAGGPIAVRMGLHTGTPLVTPEGYVGEDVHKGARIAAAGHGGQVLLSAETREATQAEVLDLGEQRLKDFARPVWIFQLGDGRFPPLKTISNTNLPRPASSFVGRETEVAQLAALVRDGARLVTLTGPGGTGKTRLAIEAAAELVPEFRNGVFWVGLAALRDPTLVTEAITQTLGAKDGLAEHIADRELLLLLDNIEQVVEASPELATLVETCPNLTLLVTSRELLRIRGEVEYPVQPLAEPDAVTLFCTRARTEPDDTVRELSRALDNLPLAIELAAARTSVLTPEQILERLTDRLDLLKGGRDADPRQQTLRATIAWSYDLLTPHEQTLYARLAVFRGGCTLDAAERICDADLDTLQSLVDKSLLRFTDQRYWMLETIREHAAERLDASTGAEESRDRHAQHYLALVESSAPTLRLHALRGPSAECRACLDRLEAEHDNLRATLTRFEATGQTQLALRMAGVLVEFWFAHNHFVDARTRLLAALAADEEPAPARAKALRGAARSLMLGDDRAGAVRCAEEAVALSRALGDQAGVAGALWTLGWLSADGEDGVGMLEEALALFGEVDDPDSMIGVTRALASMSMDRGDFDRAEALYTENLARARALGNTLREHQTLGALALLAVERGRVEEARSLAAAHLPLAAAQSEFYVSTALARAAFVLAHAGRATEAASVLGCSVQLAEDVGAAEDWVADRNDATRAVARAKLDDDALAAALERGRALTVDEGVALALGQLTRQA